MATASESPMQYERDLRSIQHEDKRHKDHTKKWAHTGSGHRPLGGVKFRNHWEDDISTFERVRPSKPWYTNGGPKRNHNINKDSAKWHDVRSGTIVNHKICEKLHAKAEINEASSSTIDFLYSPRSGRSTVSDSALYSFDATESPAPVVSLEVFVKPNTKEDEKFVENEYEILDVNGDVVKGRKARRHLRKAASASPEGKAEEELVEIDGFELV